MEGSLVELIHMLKRDILLGVTYHCVPCQLFVVYSDLLAYSSPVYCCIFLNYNLLLEYNILR